MDYLEEYKSYKSYKKEDKKAYQYVFDHFSEQILSGELKLNDKIPPGERNCGAA